MNAPIIVRMIAAGMLFLALGPWPYVYYQLLRWLVCGVCVWLVYLAIEAKKPAWAWAMGISAVLFNPVAPFYLSRGLWAVIDVIVGMVLLCSLRSIGTIHERSK